MTRAYFLAEMIRSLGLDVEIAGHLVNGSRIYPIPPKDIRVISVQGARIWQFTDHLLAHLSGDFLYAVKPKTSSFGIGLLARKKLSRPLLLDIDDWERSYRISKTLDSVKLLLMEKFIRFADAVTVNNSALQRRFGGTLLPSGKNEKLYDPTLYDPHECRSKLGLSDRFIIMFPGTAVPHSGLEDLLMAMDEIGRDDLMLVVVGGRHSGSAYIEKHLSHWSHRISHLPEFSEDLLPGVIAAAHVITAPHRDMLTSRYNFPIKLIDGIAMGKPILTTRIGDIPETLDGIAYLAEPGDSASLARALRQILDDPAERTRRGNAGRICFEERFSISVLGKIFTQLTENL